MSQKKYKQLRKEAKERNMPYELVKRGFRKLNTIERRAVLSIDKHK